MVREWRVDNHSRRYVLCFCLCQLFWNRPKNTANSSSAQPQWLFYYNLTSCCHRSPSLTSFRRWRKPTFWWSYAQDRKGSTSASDIRDQGCRQADYRLGWLGSLFRCWSSRVSWCCCVCRCYADSRSLMFSSAFLVHIIAFSNAFIGHTFSIISSNLISYNLIIDVFNSVLYTTHTYMVHSQS